MNESQANTLCKAMNALSLARSFMEDALQRDTPESMRTELDDAVKQLESAASAIRRIKNDAVVRESRKAQMNANHD